MNKALDTWIKWMSGPGEPEWNMALDEAMLEYCALDGRPMLRFYGWTEPAATFGYFQKYRDVAGLTDLRPLIRRPTGGGLVPHVADWTYSAAFPAGHPWHALRAEESYRRIHDWVRTALAEVGLESSMASCCRPEGPGQCFVGAERFDLVMGDRKIAGAAQRRRREGLLIQGSVQCASQGGADVSRAAWEEAMVRVSAGLAGGQPERSIAWEDLGETRLLLARAGELVNQKYGCAAYHEWR